MGFIPADLTEEKIREIQLAGLKNTARHAYDNSPFYRKRFESAGVVPEDIHTLEDIAKLPFITNKDLQDGYPLPLRSVPHEEIVRIHGSSGTTGKRKVLCYTARDVDVWANMFARCYELAGVTKRDRVQIAVGYGLWTAGAGFQNGCERFGAMAVPLGPANTEMHCDMLVDMECTVFCSTASMALLMAEEINKRGLLSEVKLKTIILGAERHSDAMRDRIRELMGVEHIHDIYGLTELYGPGTGLDCRCHNGIHYWSDHFIYEILDPVTGEAVPEGEVGELVVTSLLKEGSPLIRYRTHDLTRIIPGKCDCGLVFPRHDRILGRSDDMFIYKAVNIYPSQIDHVLGTVEGVGSEYQVHLDTGAEGRENMVIRVERGADAASTDDAALAGKVSTEIRRKLMVRGNIEIVEHGSLPRTQRKSKRVFDNRDRLQES